MKKVIAVSFSLMLIAAAAAFAHGDEKHLMGIVTKITDKAITVEDKDKKTTEVGVAADTKYMKGEAAASVKDIKVGDRVVINAKQNEDKLVATLVKLGTAAAPAQKH